MKNCKCSNLNDILKYTLYPKSKDIDNICFSFIQKYPFMKDSSPGGHTSWAIAIRFKVCNSRKRLRGISSEVDQNKRQEGQKSPNSGIKKLRRGIARQELPPQELDEEKIQGEMKHLLSGQKSAKSINLSKVLLVFFIH